MSHEIKKYVKAKAKASLNGNKKEIAELCNYLGDLYAKLDRHKEALSEHLQELNIVQDLQDSLGKAIAHRKIAECYSMLKSFDLAKSHALKYLNISIGTKTSIEQQRAHTTLGRILMLEFEEISCNEDEIYTNVEEYIKARQRASETLKSSEAECAKALNLCSKLKGQINDKELKQMMVRGYLNLGIVCELRKDYQKCAMLLQQALKIAKLENFMEEMQKIYFSLSEIFVRDEDYAQAITILEQAILCSQKLKEPCAEIDALTRQAEVMVKVANYPRGKFLYKRCAFLAQSSGDANSVEKVQKYLRTIKKLCHKNDWLNQHKDVVEQQEKEISSLEESTNCNLRNSPKLHRACKYHEKLGDYFSEFSCYNQALTHYSKAVELATMLEMPLNALAPLYYSVAQSYADLRNFSKAIDFGYLELKCYGFQDTIYLNAPREICDFLSREITQVQLMDKSEHYRDFNEEKSREVAKTLLNMCQYGVRLATANLTKDSENSHQFCWKDLCIIKMYSAFLSFTKYMSEALKLYAAWIDAQLNLLRHAEEFSINLDLKRDDLVLGLGKLLKRLQSALDIGEETSVVDQISDDQSCFSSDPPSSNSSGDEESDILKRSKDGNSASGRNSFAVKKNEKGETLLHKACIDGNLKRVVKLVEMGHPVNVRDNCGWTPLHEACNYGCDEVVEYLLSHGARVNDRGRDERDASDYNNDMCDGITPLHDSASVGHVSTMELLLKHGADPSLPDDHGNTPYDTLVEWHMSNCDDMDAETRAACHGMENLLLKRMKAKNIEPRIHGKVGAHDGKQSSSVFTPKVTSSPKTRKKFAFPHDRTHSKDYREIVIARPSVQIIDDHEENNTCLDIGEKKRGEYERKKVDHLLRSRKSYSTSKDIRTESKCGSSSYAQYRAAMKAIKRPPPANTGLVEPAVKKCIPALIRETENVVDHWLIPDNVLDENSSQNSRSSVKSIKERVISPRPTSPIDQNPVRILDDDVNVIRSKSPILGIAPTSSVAVESIGSSNKTFLRQYIRTPAIAFHAHCSSDQVAHMNQSKDSGRSSSPVISSRSTAMPSSQRPVMRINVLIDGHKIMIPLSLKRDADKTVAWLGREALKRYFTIYPEKNSDTRLDSIDIKNDIMIKTDEGSILYPADVASELLSDNETIRITSNSLNFY